MRKLFKGCAVVVGAIFVLGVLSAIFGGGGQRTASTASAPTAAAQVSENVAAQAPQVEAAPTTKPEPTAAPTEAPVANIATVGERREAGGMALTVVNVGQTSELSQFQKAADGKVFVLAEVVVENVNRDEAPYNPMYFKVKDADGFEYNATLNTGDKALQSGTLAAGEKSRGIVAFEVSADASGLVLSFEPIVILGGYEPIRVALQ